MSQHLTQPTSRSAGPSGSISSQSASAQPTAAFIGASWAALLLGMTAYLAGLYNAGMLLSEKGYFLIVLLYGLFSAVSLQKAVRDRMEGVGVTTIYYGLAWLSVIAVLVLLSAGLWNANELALSEKGFYGMAFTLSMFAAVAVQKNVRDVDLSQREGAATLPATTPAAANEPEWHGFAR